MINSDQNFVIRNGISTEYTGPGEDVTIPEGVTEIGISAFEGLSMVDLPRSICKLELARISENWKGEKLYKTMPESLFQTSKDLQELCKKYMKVPAEEYLSAMLGLLADCKKGSVCVQAANYVVEQMRFEA